MPNFYVIQDPKRQWQDVNITFREPLDAAETPLSQLRPFGKQAMRNCRAHCPTRPRKHRSRAGSDNRELTIENMNVRVADIEITSVSQAVVNMIILSADIGETIQPSNPARSTHAVDSERLSFLQGHVTRI
ncbi:hypothetical protein ANCDUO_00358 [Ancylostoma duodenale]|uniref:Uncharacterized protein n=1 Tax=Ancylostoma duodenale TaxID=51022 RepID=A0A0C2HI24_9BILA|nr:hypothetical protein ANCDUO_00358 [Ancylostoma duodenale]